jgi:penicillin amidase
LRSVVRALIAVAALAVLAAAAYALNVAAGMRAHARVDGTISGLLLREPVVVLRDARGVPHIRAGNEHDLFFAQGYVEGQDRLFQLDLLRRFVYGDLSEVLGSATLHVDEAARIVPVREIVQRQWDKLDGRQQMMLSAFADGVNAAAERESKPVEFRALAYTMPPWKPQDSLAVGFATVLELTDDWNAVAARVGRTLPLSDACFDAPVTQGLAGVANPQRCNTSAARAALVRTLLDARPPIGSNEWAAGSAHTSTHRALLANDPHLRLQIPGVWYLIDLRAPGYHAAGATLAGTPGVILGHNDRVAWGATNGTVASLSVFYAPHHAGMSAEKETIHVRFGGDVTRTYYRSAHLFGATVDVRGHPTPVAVRWPAYANPQSPLLAFDGLDRARSIEDALTALRAYPGPTQNFEIADTSGRVAYHLAGIIPRDPLWARGIHPASAIGRRYPPVSFNRLPQVPASDDAIVWTSNNKMYGSHYPLRLSAQFASPCRAYRVARLLRSRNVYNPAFFAAMQMDVTSPCEQSLVSAVPAFAAWDGVVAGDSRLATQAVRLRIAIAREFDGMTQAMIAQRANTSAIRALAALGDASPPPWNVAGAIVVHHPLAAVGMWFLNGTHFRGDGDSYTVHVQNDGFSQSFRAVWDVGNWDAGGISIPQGESGRPGSGHYTDEAAAWVAGRLLRLPYSSGAVDRATVDRLTLTP